MVHAIERSGCLGIHEPEGVRLLNHALVCSRACAGLPLGQEREQLPLTVVNILVHLFDCCQAEVGRILQERVDGLQRFVGTTEVVKLRNGLASGSTPAGGAGGGGGGSCNGLGGTDGAADAGVTTTDTEELLYGELRRRHRTIAGLRRKELVSLAARVLSHAFHTRAKKDFGRKLVRQTWPMFQQVARSYLALFVEVRKCLTELILLILLVLGGLWFCVGGGGGGGEWCYRRGWSPVTLSMENLPAWRVAK